MTGKKTNTIKPSSSSLGPPHVSDLIHLKPPMDKQGYGAVGLLKKDPEKQKQLDISCLPFPVPCPLLNPSFWEAE